MKKKQLAAELISQHFKLLEEEGPHGTILVSARHAGKVMVEIYRLLTNEMPQSPGIDTVYFGDETPAVEWASPVERDPGEVYYVHPGNPDLLIKGDQNGNSKEEGSEKDRPKEGQRSLGEGEQGWSLVRRHHRH